MIAVEIIIPAILGSGLLTAIINRVFAVRDRKKDKSDKILDRIDAVEKKLDKHEADEERYRADLARTRILRFSDELRRGVRHSEESFNNVLADIDLYTGYCNAHEDVYVNSKADAAIRNTREVYDRCVSGDLSFL